MSTIAERIAEIDKEIDATNTGIKRLQMRLSELTFERYQIDPESDPFASLKRRLGVRPLYDPLDIDSHV